MPSARLRRVITAVTLAVALAASTAGCLDRGGKCAGSTAKFPISGVVVKKENTGRDCYMLHVKREDNLDVETVKVSRYRYKNAELRHTVTYAAQPTD